MTTTRYHHHYGHSHSFRPAWFVSTPRVARVLFFLVQLTLSSQTAEGKVRCFSIFDCGEKVRKGSECIDGFCSNPYTKGGCLAQHSQELMEQKNFSLFKQTRTCHSEDLPETVEQGHCTPSALDYIEVRLGSQNWESAFFVCWILQILLGEMMDVPVTIETMVPGLSIDFYDRSLRFDYGMANDQDGLRRSRQFKDCRLRPNKNETCTHVIPEVWAQQFYWVDQLRKEGVIEMPGSLGALGHQQWFTRKSTAERYPEFLSYVGLRKPGARRTLAEVFKRPTTWQEYCDLVSPNNCAMADFHAKRAPNPDSDEGGKYYVGGLYKGYFRATEANNCTNNPDCTGHIVDYPCGWGSYVVPQTHHLGIALESNGKQPGSNGYSYGEMVQIWTAANATDSDVILLWWTPEALFQEFLGSDSEFTVITMPPPTQKCINHRVSTEDRCSDDWQRRLGDPLGSCAEEPHALAKVISLALHEIAYDPDVPEALHSPAYEAIKNFRLSDLQIGEMFDRWFAKKDDKWGLDPRDAVCEWVVDNLELMQSYIPRTHPRVMVNKTSDTYATPGFYVAIALASLTLLVTLGAAFLTWHKRDVPAMKYAQVEFLGMLLIGLMLVLVGALLTAVEPRNGICVCIAWFINLGYTLELVPLIVKVGAIHRLLVASEQHRRVELRRSHLFGVVFFVCALVGATLVVLTAVDPPRKEAEVKLTSDTDGNGSTIIELTQYCSSDNQKLWNYISVSWQLVLLLACSVMAFQVRKIREDLGETRTLVLMIYSHFVFIVLVFITYFLEDDGSLGPADMAAARSLIYSLDSLATVVIYFVPKFFQKQIEGDKAHEGSGQRGSNSQVPPVPLPVHTWTSRKGSNSQSKSGVEGSGASQQCPEQSLEESQGRYGSQLQSDSAVWEDMDDRVSKVLDQISEESSEVSSIDSKEGSELYDE